MMEELAKLKAKIESMQRELFKKDLELLILKSPEYSHIEFSSIDEDGLDLLMIANDKIGWDAVKKYLNDMYGLNPNSYSFNSSNKPPRMLSEVLKDF